MTAELPPAAVIEIVERDHETTDTAAGSVIVPDEIRINGQPLLVPEGRSVRVHEIGIGEHGDCAMVTLTLFARRVVIAAEGDL